MANKKSTTILLMVMGILVIAVTVVSILNIQADPSRTIWYLISLGFTALYGFLLYREPHGNMLKYAMIIFAITTIVSGCNSMMKLGKLNYNIVRILASAAVCYCAGRLNRIDQNKYLLPIIGLAFLGTSICNVLVTSSRQALTLVSFIRCFSYTINYFTIMIAYFVRFEEHKLAGIMDAPKK